jgi:hypothetical protein
MYSGCLLSINSKLLNLSTLEQSHLMTWSFWVLRPSEKELLELRPGTFRYENTPVKTSNPNQDAI